MNLIKKRILQLIIIIKFYLIKFYCIIFSIDNSDMWLISERGVDARDNAFHLYKFIRKNYPNKKIVYVIDKHSPDIERIKELGDFIYYKSFKHYVLFLTSGILISTHLMGFSPDMGLFNKLQKNNKLKLKGKTIFLGHGISKDFTPQFFRENTKLDLMIAGAKKEYDFELENYGYTKEQLKLTGLARFDNLVSVPKNRILIMPTFRKWMTYYTDDEFIKTNYYKLFNHLINNEKIIEIIEKNNIQLIFYPHHEFQKYLKLFSSKSNNIILADKYKYDVQELLISSKLLITDYSSVYFDFAYMQKPIIYYQFDYDEYRKRHYQDGYFSYKDDGFGEIIYSENNLIDKISEMIDNYFVVEKKYEKRIKNFFGIIDKSNCERIYKEIAKLAGDNHEK